MMEVVIKVTFFLSHVTWCWLLLTVPHSWDDSPSHIMVRATSGRWKTCKQPFFMCQLLMVRWEWDKRKEFSQKNLPQTMRRERWRLWKRSNERWSVILTNPLFLQLLHKNSTWEKVKLMKGCPDGDMFRGWWWRCVLKDVLKRERERERELRNRRNEI